MGLDINDLRWVEGYETVLGSEEKISVVSKIFDGDGMVYDAPSRNSDYYNTQCKDYVKALTCKKLFQLA